MVMTQRHNRFWKNSPGEPRAAESGKCLTIRPALFYLKLKIWTQFGFYTLPGEQELDMTKAVCKNN